MPKSGIGKFGVISTACKVSRSSEKSPILRKWYAESKYGGDYTADAGWEFIDGEKSETVMCCGDLWRIGWNGQLLVGLWDDSLRSEEGA